MKKEEKRKGKRQETTRRKNWVLTLFFLPGEKSSLFGSDLPPGSVEQSIDRNNNKKVIFNDDAPKNDIK